MWLAQGNPPLERGNWTTLCAAGSSCRSSASSRALLERQRALTSLWVCCSKVSVEAKVPEALLPMKFPIDKPVPVRPAPTERARSSWTWRPGDELPLDLQAACQLWFRYVEEYLLEFHGITFRRSAAYSGRAEGLR
eukprot:7601014-Pyramimonas_sp.AAC.1